MAAKIIELASCASLAPDLKALLGPPPLLEGEDAGAFEDLYERFRSVVTPRDFLEEVWVRDIVDIIWGMFRLKRLKAALMRAYADEGIKKLLGSAIPGLFSDHIVKRWARRDRNAVEEVDEVLKRAGMDQEGIAAQAIAARVSVFESIERMIMQGESRRNAMLREIDRHRDGIAQRLREVVTQIENAKHREIQSSDAAE
jgi:hypothetical protein